MPYCLDHSKTAYRRGNDRREDHLDRHEWHGPPKEERCRICYERRTIAAGIPCPGRPAGIPLDKERAA